MRGRARQSECVYVCVWLAYWPACPSMCCVLDTRLKDGAYFMGGYLCEYLHLRDAISSVCSCVCLCMHAWIGCIAQPVQTRKVNAVG